MDAPLPTRRTDLLARLAEPRTWDLAVVGGGATGLGVALDAAARGLSVVLLESHDFAAGTSSRSTKLLHGGVRYLAQGNLSLVREALHERSTVLRNAPHLAAPLSFVMPSYAWWQTPFYGLGLRLYDLLAGRAGLGPTAFLSRAQALAALPNLRADGLRGGVQYWDAQFDDARLALALARTAARAGALLLNYCAVTQLIHEGGRVAGLRCRDSISGQAYDVRARCVVNATGVWVDALRQLDGAALGQVVQSVVSPSQGVHVVVERSFLPGGHALLVPRTADGRVLFAVPWLGKLVLGTTDTPRADMPREPRPLRAELDFILGEAGRYLARAPTPADVLSIWVGLRPLVRPDDGHDKATRQLSREHAVMVSPTGLVSVTGGKWTTYRAMAEDVLAHCVQAGLLPATRAGVSANLSLVGASPNPMPPAGIQAAPGLSIPGLSIYGTEISALAGLPGAARELAPGLSEAMVRFAARNEYALTVEDVLARRTRWLFLDAAQAMALAPNVGRILAEETGLAPRVADFVELAQEYLRWPESGS